MRIGSECLIGALDMRPTLRLNGCTTVFDCPTILLGIEFTAGIERDFPDTG